MAIRVRIPLGSPFQHLSQISLLEMKIVSTIKNRINSSNTLRQLTSFLLIGGTSTVISYSTFLICLHLFKLHYILANIAGFVVSIRFSYLCNRRWTFQAQEETKFFSYLSVYLFSLALSCVLLRIFVEYCGIIPEIANIITIMITTCFNFCNTKFVVFKK